MPEDTKSPEPVRPGNGGAALAFGKWRFVPTAGVLRRDGAETKLPPRVAALLERLLESPGEIVGREELIEHVWPNTAVSEHSLSEAVGALRRALHDDPKHPTYIQTMSRRGYRFIAPIEIIESGASGPHADAPERPGAAGQPAAPSAAAVAQRPLFRGFAAAAVILVIVVIFGVDWTASDNAAAPGPVRTTVDPPDGVRITGSHLAISPDGRRIVFNGKHAETYEPQAYVRNLDDFEPRPLGIDRVAAPGFSPDGQAIAFAYGDLLGGSSLQTLRLDGAAGPTVVADTTSSAPIFWTPDGHLYYAAGRGLWKTPTGGGETESLAELAPIGQGRGGRITGVQMFVERGGALVYQHRLGTPSNGRLYWIASEGGAPSEVPGLDLENVSHVRYVPSGHLVMRRATSLVAVPFDLEGRAVAGPEVVLEQDVRSFVVSDTGTLAYLTQGGDDRFAPAWVDLNGRIERLSLPSRYCPWTFDLSPDGKTIALTCDDEASERRDIWLADLETERLEPFTFDGTSTDPVFTPDGKRLVYTTRAGDAWALVWAPTNGSGPAETLLESPHPVYPQSWHPEGEILAYLTFHPETDGDIWLLRPGRDNSIEPFLTSDADETGASFSPDGNWIGYHRPVARESFQAFVRPFPDFDPAVRVSRYSGGWPMWSEDGRTIWYRQRVGLSIFSVAVGEGPGFDPDPPVLSFPLNARFMSLTRSAPHVLEPGGKRFLMMEIVEPRREIHVVQNWFDELRRRAPAAR